MVKQICEIFWCCPIVIFFNIAFDLLVMQHVKLHSYYIRLFYSARGHTERLFAELLEISNKKIYSHVKKILSIFTNDICVLVWMLKGCLSQKKFQLGFFWQFCKGCLQLKILVVVTTKTGGKNSGFLLFRFNSDNLFFIPIFLKIWFLPSQSPTNHPTILLDILCLADLKRIYF